MTKLNYETLEELKARIDADVSETIDGLPDSPSVDWAVNHLETKALRDFAAIDTVIDLARSYGLLDEDSVPTPATRQAARHEAEARANERDDNGPARQEANL